MYERLTAYRKKSTIASMKSTWVQQTKTFLDLDHHVRVDHGFLEWENVNAIEEKQICEISRQFFQSQIPINDHLKRLESENSSFQG